jgi:pyruvate-ferredoxin/flavodoxin oxidoreductase
MREQLEHQKRAVASGYWPLYRFDPRRAENPLQLDSQDPTEDVGEFMAKENRFSQLMRAKPDVAERLTEAAREFVAQRRRCYRNLSDGPKDS